ncbi:heme o synthase [Gordonia jinhuaensis]|uniref:Protoheme IX farnesyltransferase n=1 Tax=Gordonia jinhuaensis TaxID=1517702 RepID=A0A916T1M5_9ACTN|nr:protoheme IX farnesyltransferase [Gordonia jinhuaensis]
MSGHGFAPTRSSSGEPDQSSEATEHSGVLRRVRSTFAAYVALTKPRVIELLLVATIPVMLLADRGVIHLGLIVVTLIGGWLGAASANSLNMVVDADIDQKMKRTERRPLARDAVSRRNALIFGLVLAVVSFLVLWLGANLLSAILVMITIAFYVGVYTMILKRRTWQNVVWGGAAGCMPTLVGWAAVRGSLSWEPIVLFLVIFFWTPPHTWALAMRYKEDYRAAGVPMLPVIASEARVTRLIMIYTWLTVLCTFALIPAASWIYLAVAVVAGAWFLVVVHKLYRDTLRGAPVTPLKIFLKSNEYLAIVFCGLAVDSVVNLPTILSYF